MHLRVALCNRGVSDELFIGRAMFGAVDSWVERVSGGQIRRPQPGEKEMKLFIC